jgi:hypothetical protein
VWFGNLVSSAAAFQAEPKRFVDGESSYRTYQPNEHRGNRRSTAIFRPPQLRGRE